MQIFQLTIFRISNKIVNIQMKKNKITFIHYLYLMIIRLKKTIKINQFKKKVKILKKVHLLELKFNKFNKMKKLRKIA